MASDDDAKAALDSHLLEYLSAYQDYTTLHVEMQSALRQGHLALAQARRALSHTQIGAMRFPAEIDALLVVQEREGDGDGAPPSLVAELREPPERADAEAESEPSGGRGGGDDSATLAALERMGIASGMQREIAAAVRDDGDDVVMARGDVLAVEPAQGGGAAHSVRSELRFAPGGLDDLKRAQFRAALSEGEGDEGRAARPKPQVKPSSGRDPLNWFAVLPPPPLRLAQKSFRRAAETAAQCATAQARMDAAARRYEALRSPEGA